MSPELIKRLKVGCLSVMAIVIVLLIVLFVGAYKLSERAYVLPQYDRLIPGSPTDALGPLAQTVRCLNSEGEYVPAWYHEGENGAAILFLHGLGGNRSQLKETAGLLLNQGYGVLLIDQSGHGVHPARINTFGRRESIDAIAGIDWLRERDEVDPHRIGIFGSSMGGTTAIYAASRDPDLACVVADSSYADLEEQAYHDLEMGFKGFQISRIWRPTFVKTFLLMAPIFIGKWAGFEDPVDVLPDIQCPLFLSHGQEDTRIDVDQYFLLLNTARQNEMDITTYLAEGRDHTTYVHDQAYLNSIYVFFRRHLWDTGE